MHILCSVQPPIYQNNKENPPARVELIEVY